MMYEIIERVKSLRLTMGWSLILWLINWWSQRMGRGIKGAPATPSKSWISVFLPPKRAVMDLSVFGLIHAFIFCHDLWLFLFEANISSGIGTSSTVSSPSSRSKFGQSFLMREKWREREVLVSFGTESLDSYGVLL